MKYSVKLDRDPLAFLMFIQNIDSFSKSTGEVVSNKVFGLCRFLLPAKREASK